jgi:hypothetical protein
MCHRETVDWSVVLSDLITFDHHENLIGVWISFSPGPGQTDVRHWVLKVSSTLLPRSTFVIVVESIDDLGACVLIVGPEYVRVNNSGVRASCKRVSI